MRSTSLLGLLIAALADVAEAHNDRNVSAQVTANVHSPFPTHHSSQWRAIVTLCSRCWTLSGFGCGSITDEQTQTLQP